MNLINILRKLGILRYGAQKGTFHNMKDMPDELFMSDVYNAKKDLVHKKDFQKKSHSD